MTKLQSRLISPPVLALPRQEGRYTIATDACDQPVGFVLLQDQTEGPAKPIGYWSRSLNDAEQRYDTTHRECLAVVSAVLMIRPYLEGRRFTVRTDHNALRWILSMADASGNWRDVD